MNCYYCERCICCGESLTSDDYKLDRVSCDARTGAMYHNKCENSYPIGDSLVARDRANSE